MEHGLTQGDRIVTDCFLIELFTEIVLSDLVQVVAMQHCIVGTFFQSIGCCGIAKIVEAIVYLSFSSQNINNTVTVLTSKTKFFSLQLCKLSGTAD